MIINTNKQRGASAIIAVVIIVLLVLIGSYVATVSSVSSLSTAASGGSIQAWFAARGGVEWAVHQAINNGSCVNVNNETITYSTGGLAGFQAAITCAETASVTEGSSTYDIFNIAVTGSRGSPGDETYVSRRINITITDNSAP
ncbi:MAG: hypothetical protein MI865_07255 [Proteobacteria bacterium]|nr:hypothetical protein [Pseudomonadota bacterium]